MKKTLLLSALTCGLLLSTTAIQAKSDTKTLVQHQITDSKKAFKQAPKEIIEGLQDTSKAVRYLQHKKIDEAKKLLSDATEKFDKALKDNPALDIVPLDEQIAVYENLSSAKEIEDILTAAQEMLAHYDVEGAREVLAPLKDEMDIMTTSIPMKLFPDATKEAKKALDNKDIKKALEILAGAFDTMVEEYAVIPLPLLNAQDLILDAAALDKTKKEDATALLDAAKKELNKAKVLGYTNSKSPEYKALVDQIDAVKKEIKGKNIVEKMYDKLKSDFSALVHKSKVTKVNKAEAKVNKFQKKEAKKAIKDTATFDKDAKKDEAKTIQK